ncbi:MAG TPA: CPBP family intramembrane glutamic endopeptidase [Acidimicrobiales bacterium]|nr:CPBP family intramembrane glutamic endopeptidase [Acidimicrobiales bacterium]
MTDSEPGGAAPGAAGPPARPPGPVPDGYVPREWLPPAPAPAVAPPPAMPPYDATFSLLPPPPSVLPESDVPFLDTPWVPPQTKRQGWVWLVYAVGGFLVGQLGALIFGYIAGGIAGKTATQMTAIASAAVPPEWYVVSTLLGLWIGFIGAPWLASRTQGTRRFFRDLGVRFRVIDLVGIAIGIGGQILVAIMYAPFQHDIKNFNGPSQKLTGASHGAGFVVIAIATVLLAPVMEELFFRGLLLKALVRLLTKVGAAGGARAAGVVLAVIVDGLLFGLAHGEWVQLAGLAAFGMILAAVSYRTGRLGMNMVAHASFNLVAIIAIAANGSVIIH